MTRSVTACVLLAGLGAGTAAAQQVVTVTVPPSVSFLVTNVATATSGSPSPVTVSFSNATGFTRGRRLRILVKADSATFSGPPGSAAIAAGSVSWVASGARGMASNGTLSAVTYNEVFRTNPNPRSGSVSVTWQLAAIPPAGLLAGSHSITVRWRFEAL